jgi:hypothetical protein
MSKKDNFTEYRAQQRESTIRELASYGIFPTANVTTKEISDLLKKVKKERGNKPDCFSRSFSSVAAACRVCDLRSTCGGPLSQTDPDKIVFEVCSVCETGLLSLECHNEVGLIVDYKCSTDGCTNSLLRQDRFIDPDDVDEQLNARNVRVTLKGHRPDESIDKEILEYVSRHTIKNKDKLAHVIKGGKNRVTSRISVLIRSGRLKKIKGKGFQAVTPKASK